MPGDRVVYLYQGSYRPTPVRLEERILSRDGEKLVIDDQLTSGSDQRHWRMHVTDTPENERANKIDELVEVAQDGSERRLDKRDLLRLFAGTFLRPDGKQTDVVTTRTTCDVLGRRYPCTATSAKQSVGGVVCTTHEAESDAFAWTHVSADYVKPDGSLLYRVSVIDLAP